MRGRFELNPVIVGHRECEAWVAYYRRDWPRFLLSAIGMVHAGFGMSRDRTARGAWHVLRANRFWAASDPVAARRSMQEFYRLLTDWEGLSVDPAVAAGLEVEWWQLHRLHRAGESTTAEHIVDGIAALYDYLHRADPSATRRAARLRVEAMECSDRWVAAGRVPGDPLLIRQRQALVDSYTQLKAITGGN